MVHEGTLRRQPASSQEFNETGQGMVDAVGAPLESRLL